MGLNMSSIKYVLVCAALFLAAHTQTVFAQHEGHTMPPPKPAATPATKPSPNATPSPEMPAEEMDMDMSLMPTGRMGSGTSWQPDSTPMAMSHKQ